MMDVADNKIAIYDKGIEVNFVEPLEVEAAHFLPTQRVILRGLNHAMTVGPVLEQARLIDGAR
jgi:hypothetical protein